MANTANFLGTWEGKLVCDDFVGGYKASFELGITEIGYMAHARSKFFDLHVANRTNWWSRHSIRLAGYTKSSYTPKK